MSWGVGVEECGPALAAVTLECSPAGRSNAKDSIQRAVYPNRATRRGSVEQNAKEQFFVGWAARGKKVKIDSATSKSPPPLFLLSLFFPSLSPR